MFGDPPRTWPSTLAVSVLIAVVAVSGWIYSHRSAVDIKETKEKELLAIARLKADTISHWMEERYGDARAISDNPILAGAVRDFFDEDPQDPSAEKHIKDWLDSIVSIYGYHSAMLYDSTGRLRITVPDGEDASEHEVDTSVAEAMDTGKVVLSDIYFGRNNKDIFMSLTAPVIDPRSKGAPVIGCVKIVIDPNTYLYPFIQRWPTPSPTAETLLVRRQGENVVFLNELRHRKNTALRLIYPMSRKDLPAAVVASGYEGVFSGVDYKNAKVISAVMKVPDMPWFIVSKVELAEIYGPIKAREALIFSIVFLGITALIAITVLYHRKTVAEFLMRRYSAELERHIKELDAVNKELDSFSYSVSHDLRTPLRAIDGFSRILEQEYGSGLDGEGRRIIGVIRDGAGRMSQLIDDMLAFSRVGRQGLKITDVDMDSIARESYEELRPSTDGRDVRLELLPMPSAKGDPAMLRQVFFNLFSNSIKFTRPKASAHIKAGGWAEAAENVYYVKDDGVGFDMNYSGKMFGVFQRLHSQEEFEGTGVGLALVARIVVRHGGRVWAEGKVGEGASLYFSLPNK